MESMSEIIWELDKMLEHAKKNPMPICYDYNTRFQIWVEQILRGRFNKIIETGGNPEYIKRMKNLTIEDYDRLLKRAQKEFHLDHNIKQYNKRNQKLFNMTANIIKLYEEQKHD